MSTSIEVEATDAVGTKVSLVILIPGGTGTGGGGSQSGPRQLKIAAGGFIRGLDIVPDGTMACFCDTYGAFIYDPAAPDPGNAGGSGVWNQLVTPSRMPVGDPSTDLVDGQAWAGNAGAWELRIAPSNSQIIYMAYTGRMYKSTNKGATWTLLAGWTAVGTSLMPSNFDQTLPNSGPRMAIDPINPSIIYFTTTANAWVSLDGGTTFTSIPSGTLPFPTAAFVAFAYDNRVSTQSGGKSTTLYAFVAGVGCFKTTNAGQAGTTWTKISGVGTATTALTTVRHIIVDSQGNVWVADNTGNFDNGWKYNGTTWTNYPWNASMGLNFQSGHSISEDPTVASAQRIVFGAPNGILNQTLDGGTTWHGGFSDGVNPNLGWGNRVATDQPSLAAYTDDPNNGDMKFNAAGNLIWASGVGVWSGTVPTVFNVNTNWNAWNSISAGIEQLVANQIVSPPSGVPITASWDRAFYRSADPEVYPVTDEPTYFIFPPGGSSVDWATFSPSTIWAVSGTDGNLFISSNGGQTWTIKAAPSGAGGIQAIAASSATNAVMMLHNGNMKYTIDAGTTWNDLGSYFLTNFGIANNSMFLNSNGQYCCADRVNADTFYIYVNSNGFYRTTTKGVSWTKQSAMGGANQVPNPYAGGNEMLRSVYSKAGHLIWCGGQTYQGSHPYTAASNTYISTDGGVTWNDLSANIRDVWGIDTGPQVGTYPRITLWGYKNVSGTWTLAVWKSDDSGVTWSQAAPYTMQGTFDMLRWLEVDKNNPDRFYTGYTGSGWSYNRP